MNKALNRVTLTTMLLLTMAACSPKPIPVEEQNEPIEQVEQPEQPEQIVEERVKEAKEQEQIEIEDEELPEGYQIMPDGTWKLTEEAATKYGKEAFMSLEEVTERPKDAVVVTVPEMLIHIRNNDSGHFLVSDAPGYQSVLFEQYPMSVYQAEDWETGPAQKYEYKRADKNTELWGNIKRYKDYIYWELYYGTE